MPFKRKRSFSGAAEEAFTRKRHISCKNFSTNLRKRQFSGPDFLPFTRKRRKVSCQESALYA